MGATRSTGTVSLSKQQKDADEFGEYLGFSDFGAVVRMAGKYFVSTCDGVGTKVMLAEDLKAYDTIGIDLVAMCENDLLCMGATTETFMDYYACDKLDLEKSKQIIGGIEDGLEEVSYKARLVGGETAQMHGMFKEYKDFDIAGWAIGERKFPFNRETAMSGTFLVGLPSSGVHSNGLTTLRERLNPLTFKSYSREFITPTRIYTKDILAIKDIIHGCAHITGGGLTRNISRILRSRQSFRLTCELDPWWESLAKRLSMNVIEMRSMFNCGWGMVVTTERPEDVMARVNGSAIIGEVI
jgi:phosphoribosylformylglycinamidine cyclo-ligase